MNKLLPTSLVVLAVAAAGASVYLLQKPGFGQADVGAATDYLPAETVALLSIPNPGQTVADWRGTDLYKIWTEGQVQAFLAKPLSRLPVDKQLGDTWGEIVRLHPSNVFVALTALDPKNSQPHLVGGFQYKGNGEDVDKLLTAPKEEFRQKFPGGKADLVNYQGHSIETFDAGEGNVLASVYVRDWYLISNDLALLKATLDRVDHHAPAGDGTLDKQPDFVAVVGKMPKNPATLIFVRPQVFMDKVYALAAASGQAVDPAQRAEADKVKAVGATTTLEEGKLRDTIYTLAPGHKHPPDALQLSGLPLSSPDTLLSIASLLNIPERVDLPANAPAAGASGAAGYQWLGQFFQGFSKNGLTLEQFRSAFGHEATVQLDWPANSQQPGLLVSLDVRDAAAAGKFVDAFTAPAAGTGDWQTTQANGATLHTLALTQGIGVITPTLVLGDKHLVFGLSPGGVLAALQREKSGGVNFTGGQAYKDGMATVPKGNVASGYLDSRVFFERLYGVLKPAALLGTTLLYPQANDYVDLGKLPDTETISKHLGPIVFSQSSDDQGTLVQSTGPVTFFQAGAGLAAISGVVAFPIIQKQYGLFGHPENPADSGSQAPDATPESSPSDSP